MSVLKLEYEVLVSGIYPFKGKFEKNGFKIVEQTVDVEAFNNLASGSVIYISPFLGMCCYPNEEGAPIYLTLQKEECIKLDYGSKEEYDVEFTNKYLESLNLFGAIDSLEKTMVLEVNNDIKFPIKMIKVYNKNNEFVTLLADFKKLNIPALLNTDKKHVLEVIKRQENRLSSGISYEKIIELKNNNKFFKNALSMYHNSFAISDYNVSFMLLIISLEAILGLATYSEVEKCESCGQPKYLITRTISNNVSQILMDKEDDVIKRKIKKLYSERSKFVHEGKEVQKENEQELQEYVRKVLLMYWFVSMNKKTYEHKEIIGELLSEEYRKTLIYKIFLNGLDNTSFEEKKQTILKDILCNYLSEKN